MFPRGKGISNTGSYWKLEYVLSIRTNKYELPRYDGDVIDDFSITVFQLYLEIFGA